MLRRELTQRNASDFPIVRWSGTYHAIPVEVVIVCAARTRWEWQLSAHGARLPGQWSLDSNRSEATALRRALARVATVFAIAEAPSQRMRTDCEHAERKPRGARRRRIDARERQASLPGIV